MRIARYRQSVNRYEVSIISSENVFSLRESKGADANIVDDLQKPPTIAHIVSRRWTNHPLHVGFSTHLPCLSLDAQYMRLQVFIALDPSLLLEERDLLRTGIIQRRVERESGVT